VFKHLFATDALGLRCAAQSSENKWNKKSPVNARGNARQRFMCENLVQTKFKLTINDVSFRLNSGWRLAPYPVHEFKYWLTIANFSYHLSFSALIRGNLFRIYEKDLRFLKLESSRQLKVKTW